MSLKKKYQKSLEKKWCLRFKTIHPDGDNFDGVVTGIKPDFIVIREEEDFDFNGVVVLPKRSIRGYRDGKYDRCCNEILRETGTIDQARSPDWLNETESLREVISELAKRDIWPVVEALYKKKTRSAFYIGPITKAGKDRFYLYYYDSAGKWQREYEIKYNEIFKIEFDTNYANRFNDFMRNRTIDSPASAREKANPTSP
jgi:hypothetical protein